MFDVAFICPTTRDSEELYTLAGDSVSGLGSFHPIFGSMNEDTTSQIIRGIRKYADAHKEFFVIMHHDFVLASPMTFLDLILYMKENGLSAAGVSECNHNRGHQDSALYLNTQFLVVRRSAYEDVLPWHWRDGVEPYWSMQVPWMGKMIYLKDRPHSPPIGKATEVLWNDKVLGAHLWRSVPDLRIREGRDSIEGCSREDLWSWRKEFIDHWRDRIPSLKKPV